MDFNDLGFASNYHVEVVERAPAQTPDYRFKFRRGPSESGQLSFESQPRGENAHLLNIVTDECNVWTGEFEAGPEGINGIFATPSPNTVFVVIQGQGYWIPTLQPASYEVVAAVPIKQVLRVPERDIILFVDFTRIEAYGLNGRFWLASDLSWDGVQITEVNPHWIRGIGWDSPMDRHVEFTVDTSTGMTTGGSSPRHYTGRQ